MELFIGKRFAHEHMNTRSQIFKNWLYAFRLRTLPLAFACVFLGSFLAHAENLFKLKILLLGLLTTLFLQILSNLANDLGDSQNGADNQDRIGPKRTVQSGAISKKKMKIAIILCGILAFLSGVYLIYEGTKDLNFNSSLIFLLLGILAIFAALKYTMGKNPYGYMGLGDLSVFLFFGCLGVLGTYYLHTHQLNFEIILPAFSLGFFCVAVLNLNNMRDIQSDKKANKITIPVRLGLKNAKIYHWALILFAWICAGFYSFLNFNNWKEWIYFLLIFVFLRQLLLIQKIEKNNLFDPFLKQTALATLLFALAFGFCQVL